MYIYIYIFLHAPNSIVVAQAKGLGRPTLLVCACVEKVKQGLVRINTQYTAIGWEGGRGGGLVGEGHPS
jgi:hypothetical protein